MSETESQTENPTDSYAAYRYLRHSAPVMKMENGPWQISRHADVNQVLRDNQTFSSDVSMRPPEERTSPSMLFSDPPVHNHLRKLVSVAFKPSHIAAQRPLITARCESLVLAMRDSDEVDLVDALAAPLPVTVIAEMLGVAGGDMRQFKHWSDAIFSNIGDILFASPSPEAEKASLEMDTYFLARIEEIRQSSASHLLGRLVETETDEGKLTNEELLSFCRLLLIAGNETTTGLITASVRIFNEFPETLGQLRAQPALVPTFIEEALRYYSPFSATIRKTTRDVKIAGVTIPRGDLVLPLMASANRDETVFDRAESFVIDRNPNPHLAFGFGIHFCLGAHLARLEGEIAVTSLVRHFDSIRLTGSMAGDASMLGGPKSLRVSLSPAKH